jgi:hypothetical protein
VKLQAEIQRVHDIVLRYPAGIGIARLEQELGSSISRLALACLAATWRKSFESGA